MELMQGTCSNDIISLINAWYKLQKFYRGGEEVRMIIKKSKNGKNTDYLKEIIYEVLLLMMNLEILMNSFIETSIIIGILIIF